jgi:putative redox protein
MAFRGVDRDGLQILMDAGAEVGGKGRGPKPIDVLAMALGGCTGMDVITLLRNRHQEVTAYEVRISGPRAETHPKVFTSLTVEHVVSGNAIDESYVRSAITRSATCYCPANAMLGEAVEISQRYRILNAAGEELASGDVETLARVER